MGEAVGGAGDRVTDGNVRRGAKGEFSQKKSDYGVALCAEAQADGVPCTESGRRCEECERGREPPGTEAW